jgi:peroxin-6
MHNKDQLVLLKHNNKLAIVRYQEHTQIDRCTAFMLGTDLLERHPVSSELFRWPDLLCDTDSLDRLNKTHLLDKQMILAKRVTLARVKANNSSGFIDYSPQIKAFFKHYKIISKHQVIPIPTQTGNVYFKCTEIEMARENEEFALVHPQLTILETTGAVNSRVPFEFDENEELFEHEKQLLAYVKPIVQACEINPAVFLHLKANLLLIGGRRSGKRIAIENVTKRLGIHLFEFNAYHILGSTEMETLDNLRKIIAGACDLAPVAIHMRRLGALTEQSKAQGRDDNGAGAAFLLKTILSALEEYQKNLRLPIILIASTSRTQDVGSVLRSSFTHEIKIEILTETQRKAVLKKVLEDDTKVSEISKKSAGLSQGDLFSFMSEIIAQNYSKNSDSFEDMFLGFQARISASLGGKSMQIPSVKWEDVGGLGNVKDEIKDVIELPLKFSNLFGSQGVKARAGILLYGPPGTGKTLLAKAIATECSFNFMSVKGPELLNMYVGESESNVRHTFEKARAAKPCILFFDELDSLAPFRGNGSDGGGVMDRVVSQLLTELDGLKSNSSDGIPDIFVVGATNRPDLLDSALLRPGRLDRCLYLGISDNREDQVKILKALTRKFHLDSDVDFAKIALECPLNFTGADFYALCSDAILSATKRKVGEIERLVADYEKIHGVHITPNQFLSITPVEEWQPLVSQFDFISSLKTLSPSVSISEIRHYQSLRERFSVQQHI